MAIPKCKYPEEPCHQICSDCFEHWDGNRTIHPIRQEPCRSLTCCFCGKPSPTTFWVSLGDILEREAARIEKGESQ